MNPSPQYIPATPAAAPPEARPDRRRSPVATAGVWFFALASLILVGLSAVVAWRWVDRNLLHWGIDEGQTTEVNSAELLRRVRAFELATVKHTYQGNAEVDARNVLNAGPASVSLPPWLAGQQLKVKGNAVVTAGVDLSKVRPEDMQVTRNGRDTTVTITLPPPEILSTELVPGTLDMDTSAGLLTRIRTSVGLSENDLRDRAADQVALLARESAMERGILDEASFEAERRLQTFLNSLPQDGDGRTTYVVQVRPPAAQ
jgi:hypothetical protein